MRDGPKWVRKATAALAVSLIGLMGVQPAKADSTTVTFGDFSDLSQIVLSGDTAGISNPVTEGGAKVLRLTNDLDQSGGAFLKDPIPLEGDNGFKASFSTAFDFQISNPLGCTDVDGVQGADGLVFVVQTDSNQYGGTGGQIGYGGIPKSVGIEFDTWYNTEYGDADGNHVAVLTNGVMTELAHQQVTEGAMNNGGIWHAWVDYDGDAKTLEVRVTQSATRPATPQLTYNIDLPAVLGQANAYVGFTSGTGCGGNNHDIRAWQFTNTYDPIPAICSVPSGFTWLPPMSDTTPATVPVDGTLPIQFQYNDCNEDSSVSLLIQDAAGNVVTGDTLGGIITFDSTTGTYEDLFSPADFGLSAGTQLKVSVYFGNTLRGSALINIE